MMTPIKLLNSFLFSDHRDAMKMAEEAEQEILKATSNVFQVSLQLRLGRPIPLIHCE